MIIDVLSIELYDIINFLINNNGLHYLVIVRTFVCHWNSYEATFNGSRDVHNFHDENLGDFHLRLQLHYIKEAGHIHSGHCFRLFKP